MNWRCLLLLISTAVVGLSVVQADSSNETDTGVENPYFSGCLHQTVTGKKYGAKKRVCNSNDPDWALGKYCQLPDPQLDYLEIRLNTGNWDSFVAETWILQIILSEILGVPTTVDSGAPMERRSLYELDDVIDQDATVVRDHTAESANQPNCDCRFATENGVQCGHYMGEVWNDDLALTQSLIHEKKLESPQSMGMLGKESWMVTKFTTEMDPTLGTYHGFVGEKNRRKLAETFLRPTTWQQYCEEESPNNCSTPDKTAQRPPHNATEHSRMFFPGEYQGYFRNTTLNDCDTYPTNCTGHAANYPCGWTSRMEASIYHLEMGLDCNNPNGQPMPYAYQQLVDMWEAANATKSNLLMMWWTPTQEYSQFLGHDAEMQRITLKPATQACIREQPIDECSPNLTERVGGADGACDNAARPLQKILSGCLYDAIHAPSIPLALQSPAYETLRRFQITDTQMDEIFRIWQSSSSPRKAVCEWASTNLDYLQSNIPLSYPRVTMEEPHSKFGYALTGIGVLTALLVLWASFQVHQNRSKPSIRFAQTSFLWLILSGSFLVAVGAVLTGLPVTDAGCTSQIWFIHLGYTLALVPMCIKVAAINTLSNAASKMRRVKIPRSQLFGAVAVISALCGVYLLVWSVLDPPQREGQYSLLSETNTDTDLVEHVVGVAFYCSGNSNVWQYVAVGWNAVLLLCASVLAFQNRNTLQAFNESRTLAILIYSNFVFVVLRCITYLLSGHLNGTTLDHMRSMIYSLDTAATVIIYFVPKFWRKTTERDLLHLSSDANSVGSGISRISGLGRNISGLEGTTIATVASTKLHSHNSRAASSPWTPSQANQDHEEPHEVSHESNGEDTGEERMSVTLLLCPSCKQNWKRDD
ncbi:Gamma-aminobutyric acid (GABA) B receptor [Seminavis robusta]|uniref:Gamma-aminobutyric acid (GABA) B receptor n=1 Tax=Seminavis robusta TaxID=568900 RepID=A0A9N8F012_9STRA|nr:Gamma-aminobutyric acid (GABA) B receptor [Seminavis robusta]|eukprot:Sro2781_g336940.1 Gamma-aminobutyric acid (GABA) B receptor (871) ;mRNA; r:1936-5047